MRHVRSLLYAVGLAPVVWILAAAGLTHDAAQAPALGDFALLALAGAAYAVLLFAPISPAGPLLAAVAFFGAGVWALAAPGSYERVWGGGDTLDPSRPGYAVAALLTVPLIAAAWRGGRRPGPPPFVAPDATAGRVTVVAAVAPSSPAAAGGADSTVHGDEEPTEATPTEEMTADLAGEMQTVDLASDEPTAAGSEAADEQGAATDDDQTHDLSPDHTVDLAGPGGLTQVIPIERIRRAGRDGDQTQVIGNLVPMAGDQTQLLAQAPDADTTTQVITPDPVADPATAPGEDGDEGPTQALGLRSGADASGKAGTGRPRADGLGTGDLGSGTVEPPGDHTQVLRIPTAADTAAGSGRKVEADQPGTRPSFKDMERPADEAADDTRRLDPPPRIPEQRSSGEDHRSPDKQESSTASDNT
ncbi:hypothetical protein [Mangrovihabitans endophyticus]|uniref:Uncharacterized protein n=1 Tax=Mangrovihabitans endophyticus TaxID=1751298 RepID=A0A8J3BYU0_9ACTN|nr:hypothetical protein [Mangrovihabitans endophyticus]GGK85872.1 hypothetical protein GCM10012284_20170 [Mangrovihabitans endophyticus]